MANAVREATRLLAQIPYFLPFSRECPASFERLAQEAILRTYDKGQIIFLEGDPCVGMYVVKTGWVKSVKISPSGREQTVRVVGPDEVFNETSVLMDTFRNHVTVIALEPARLWVIRREVLLNLMDECPRLARTITQHMAARVHHLMGLIEDLSLRSVKARLSRYILEHSAEEKIPRQPWATQSEIAARLGTVADVISRILNNLEEEGVIQLDRRQILVLDRRRLEILAELE